jgi:hypothetical protein
MSGFADGIASIAMTSTSGIFWVTAFKEKAGFFVALLVQIMKQIGVRLRRQRVSEMIESGKDGLQIRLGPGRAQGLHSSVQVGQRFQDILLKCSHVEQERRAHGASLPVANRKEQIANRKSNFDLLQARLVIYSPG